MNCLLPSLTRSQLDYSRSSRDGCSEKILRKQQLLEKSNMKIIISIITTGCLFFASMPGRTQETLTLARPVGLPHNSKTNFIRNGTPLDAKELSSYQQLSEKRVSRDAGGEERDNTGLIILASIGAIVL